MCKVLNKRDNPKSGVYIGRPSIFGNPFVIGRDGNREEVVKKYRVYLERNPDLIKKAKLLLKGKDLVCYCAPQACHGDVLLEFANKE